jgi:glycine cleavage system H protein
MSENTGPVTTPADTRFAPTHEWARKAGDEFVIGISEHAQRSLGDIVFVDLPRIGAEFAAKASFGAVESIKAASDIYLPLGGRIIAVNEKLAAQPELVNKDCYGEGWFVRILPANPGEWEALLSGADYGALIASGA